MDYNSLIHDTVMILHIILFIRPSKWRQIFFCIKRPEGARTLIRTGLSCLSDFTSQGYHGLGEEGRSCVGAG